MNRAWVPRYPDLGHDGAVHRPTRVSDHPGPAVAQLRQVDAGTRIAVPPSMSTHLRPARRARFAFDFHIGDPDADPPLDGYTDGRTWNGFAIPLLPVGEVLRMFRMVVDAGTACAINANTVRITDADGSYDLIATEFATEDGPRWLVDCNLAMTFHDVTPDDESAA